MVLKTYEGKPNYAVHPGEMLAEYIDVYHCEKEELAARIDITPKHLSNIVNCKAGITAKTAAALEMVFPGKSAESWLNGQQRYDLFCIRQERRDAQREADACSKWLSLFEYDELSGMGYVSKTETALQASEKATELLSFFGCASIDAWETVYGAAHGPMRDGAIASQAKPGNALAWLRKGERQASLQFSRLPRLDRRAFARSLKRIRKSSGLRGSGAALRTEVFSEVKERCAASGVMLISEPAPSSQTVQSALFWSRQAPCIQMNGNLTAEDEFWFGFAREAERLLEASGKEVFIDMRGSVLEWVAVDDAYDWLVPVAARREFLQRADFSVEAVIRFSEETGVSPGVIVGWLQAQGKLSNDAPAIKLKSHIDYAVVPLE